VQRTGELQMREGLVQVELLNSCGESAIYWIPAAPEIRLGLRLRLRETGGEEWTVKQTFTTCLGVPPVPHRLGTPEPSLSESL
jgi:hypothetical protein